MSGTIVLPKVIAANFGGKDASAALSNRINSRPAPHISAYAPFYGPSVGNAPKHMHVIYTFSDLILEAVHLKESEYHMPARPKLYIVAALYGSADVTHQVKKLIPTGADTVKFKVENSVLGDHDVGYIKIFTVYYIRRGVKKSLLLNEGDTAELL